MSTPHAGATEHYFGKLSQMLDDIDRDQLDNGIDVVEQAWKRG